MDSMQIMPIALSQDGVGDSYESAWKATRTRLEREIATGDSLASILGRMGRLRLDHHMPRYWREDPKVYRVGRRILQAHGIDDEDLRNPYYPAVVDGRYTVNSGFNTIRYLYNNVLPETTTVIEFGSGWSANLFQLFILLGERRSRDLKFYGAEYTHEGRATGAMLAAHVPGMNYEAVAFDWTRPDLSFVDPSRGLGHVLVFSHHSIEQVPEISADFYRQLGDLAESVVCVHVEPVGWQRSPDLRAKRRDDDAAFFNAIQQEMGVSPPNVRVPVSHGDDLLRVDTQMRMAAWWSWARGYNHNLLELVDTLAVGDLRVRQVMFDIDSLMNPLNPSTLINVEVGTAPPKSA